MANVRSINRDRRIPDEVLHQLSDSELLELRTLLQEDADSIKTQLGEARARVYAQGEYSDPEWYSRAEQALRGRGTNILRLQNERGRRRDARRKQATHQGPASKGNDFGFRLLKAMDELLPPDLKKQVIALALEQKE